MEYIVKEKRDYSPYFDLHFDVKIDDERSKEFSFPVYDDTKPFTEEEYMAMIKTEMEYAVSLETAPPIENEPVPIDGF